MLWSYTKKTKLMKHLNFLKCFVILIFFSASQTRQLELRVGKLTMTMGIHGTGIFQRIFLASEV